jgi:hypothetical protein
MKQGTKSNKGKKNKTNKLKKVKAIPLPVNTNRVNTNRVNTNPANTNLVNTNLVNKKATLKSPQRNTLTPNNFEEAFRAIGLGMTRAQFKAQY